MTDDPFATLWEPTAATVDDFNDRMHRCGLDWRVVADDRGRWRLLDGDAVVPYPVDSPQECLTALSAQVFVAGALYGHSRTLQMLRERAAVH